MYGLYNKDARMRTLNNPNLFPPLEEARYAELEMVNTASTQREVYVFKPRRGRRYSAAKSPTAPQPACAQEMSSATDQA